MDCVYCDNEDIRSRTIVTTKHAWAFPTNIPITPMHVLVAPTRHVSKLEELTEDERQDCFDLIVKLQRVLGEKFGAQGFNCAWNVGEIAGQSVPHLHFHIVPRTTGDTGIYEYEPRTFLYRPGSREATPEAELRAVADTIKAAL